MKKSLNIIINILQHMQTEKIFEQLEQVILIPEPRGVDGHS
jgi:hypothetical protein